MGSVRTTPGKSIPRWKCQKIIRAFKIKQITKVSTREDCRARLLVPVDPQLASVRVEAAYLSTWQPQVGGYYAVTLDGVESFIDAKDFERDFVSSED